MNTLSKLLTILFAGALAGCTQLTVSKPLRTADNPSIRPASSGNLLAQTHTTVSDPGEKGEQGDEHIKQIIGNPEPRQGLHGYGPREVLAGRREWTMTAWYDERSMLTFNNRQYRQSTVRNAGDRLPLNTRPSNTHKQVNRATLPLDWKQAIMMIDESARSYTF